MADYLDNEGYPTDEYLKFIKDYTPEVMPIMSMVNIICDNWYYQDWGVKMGRKYKGTIKLELHTAGWSGNEDIIHAILKNIYLTHFKMLYKKWITGGHYYFEIKLS